MHRAPQFADGRAGSKTGFNFAQFFYFSHDFAGGIHHISSSRGPGRQVVLSAPQSIFAPRSFCSRAIFCSPVSSRRYRRRSRSRRCQNVWPPFQPAWCSRSKPGSPGVPGRAPAADATRNRFHRKRRHVERNAAVKFPPQTRPSAQCPERNPQQFQGFFPHTQQNGFPQRVGLEERAFEINAQWNFVRHGYSLVKPGRKSGAKKHADEILGIACRAVSTFHPLAVFLQSRFHQTAVGLATSNFTRRSGLCRV